LDQSGQSAYPLVHAIFAECLRRLDEQARRTRRPASHSTNDDDFHDILSSFWSSKKPISITIKKACHFTPFG
jgi:hypothetical protein